MKRQKLYAVDMVAYPPEAIEWKREAECAEWELENYEVVAEEVRDGENWVGFYKGFTPEGWAEYALDKWPNYEEVIDGMVHYVKPFFWPSTDKVFRSRSAAQYRVDLIERWGGQAVLLECEPEWVPVAQANRHRKIERLEAQAERAEEKARELRTRAALHAQIAFAAEHHPELVPSMEATAARVESEAC